MVRCKVTDDMAPRDRAGGVVNRELNCGEILEIIAALVEVNGTAADVRIGAGFLYTRQAPGEGAWVMRGPVNTTRARGWIEEYFASFA